MNNNPTNPDDPNGDRYPGNTGGERQFGQPRGNDGDRDRRDPFEDSLAQTWDAPDASVDRRLRAMVGPVTPLYPPPYGYERVVLRARRRRHRTAAIAAAASVVAVAVVAGGVVAGTRLNNGSVAVAGGCDNVSQSAPGAAKGIDGVTGIDQSVNVADVTNMVDVADARGGSVQSGPSGIGAERGVMDRKYEVAIGGVLTAAALSVGIVAGCSSSANDKGPSANATQSGGPSSPSQSSAGSVTLPAPSGSGTTTPSATGVPRCHTADLSPAVNIVTGSAGAGSESINIKLTNQSGHDCTVYGYPGMKLEDTNASGQATTVTRNHSAKPATLTVANGGSVATTGRFDFDVPASDEPQTGNCEAPSVYLEITPPDETTQLSTTIAGGPVTVCQHGTIDVLPFIAGSTGPNQ